MGTDTAPTKNRLLSGRMCASSNPLHQVCGCVCEVSLLTSPIKQGASPLCLLLPRSAKARFRCLTGQPLAVDDLRSGVQAKYEVFLSGSFFRCVLMRLFLTLHVSRAHGDAVTPKVFCGHSLRFDAA